MPVSTTVAMTPEALVSLITTLPFAVLVAGWLLWRIDPLLKKIGESQAAQLELMRLVTEKLNSLR